MFLIMINEINLFRMLNLGSSEWTVKNIVAYGDGEKKSFLDNLITSTAESLIFSHIK
jgi:hypothetical protein